METERAKKHRKAHKLSTAAVHKRIAAFFYSIKFHIIILKMTRNNKTINKSGAAQLQRLRLFFGVKGHYIAFYRSRAPPSDLKSHQKHFKIGGYIMIIKYAFADGTVSEVEVDEAIGSLIIEYRQAEENLSRKEHYHCFSVESSIYEGKELSTGETPEIILQRKNDKSRNEILIDQAMSKLTETQRRRLIMVIKGYSMRKIARLEGVGTNSVAKSICGARKYFLNFFRKGLYKTGGGKSPYSRGINFTLCCSLKIE